MKINRETDAILELEYQAILFPALFGIIAFIAFLSGLLDQSNTAWIKFLAALGFSVAAFSFAKRVHLYLDADEGYANLSIHKPFRSHRHSFQLSEISHFDVQTGGSDDVDTSRLVLVVNEDQTKIRYDLSGEHLSWRVKDLADKGARKLYRYQSRSDPSAL